MSKDPYVSPYLLRPLRSYEQALREREDRKSPGVVARDARIGSGCGGGAGRRRHRRPGRKGSMSDHTPSAMNPERDPRSSDLARTISELERAPRPVLAERWRSLYRCDPPKAVGQRFLIGAIAYALQMRQAGRSASSIHRRLERHVRTHAAPGMARSSASRQLRPGTRLIREWNGSTHTVDVAEDGYLWNGTRYRSLSAIARAITGTRWSGPRFFGTGRENDR